MSKHFWYLFEELIVALCFFDDAVSFETKQHMVTNLQGKDDEPDTVKRPQHSIRPGFDSLAESDQKTLKSWYSQLFCLTFSI